MSANTTRTRLLRNSNEQSEAVRIEILCSSCGFGAVVTVPPARCPMCGSSSWAGVALNGSGRIGREKNDVPRNGQEQRTMSLTNGASHGGPQRKEQVMEGLDCEGTAGR
jgi:hypothetical protein